MQEIYISIDIEADGRLPGMSSMLSFGAAAFTLDKRRHGWYSCNFELLDGAEPHPEVDEFWRKNPDAYTATRKNLVSPEAGSRGFITWLEQFAKYRAFCVGYPIVFDAKWMDYYLIRFTGNNPFGHSRYIDVKSYAWGKRGGKFSHVSKRHFPKKWFDPARHTHIALDDAIEQGLMFVNMVRDVQGLPPVPAS